MRVCVRAYAYACAYACACVQWCERARASVRARAACGRAASARRSRVPEHEVAGAAADEARVAQPVERRVVGRDAHLTRPRRKLEAISGRSPYNVDATLTQVERQDGT
eukprot:3552282-Pleurochrysis_carterae.AAC.2